MSDQEIKIGKLETCMEIVRSEVTDLKTDFKTLSQNINTKFDKFISIVEEKEEKYNKKFATKQRVLMVERVVYGATGAILLAFIGVVIKFVFNQ